MQLSKLQITGKLQFTYDNIVLQEKQLSCVNIPIVVFVK